MFPAAAYRMTKIELSLSIRIYDSRPMAGRGHGQHRILIRDEDDEDESGYLKTEAVKPSP